MKTINQKNRYEKYKTVNLILESVDTIDVFGVTSTSIAGIAITGIGLIVLPISAGEAGILS